MNSRQRQILDLLNKHPFLATKDILKALKLTRARLNQLITPLIKQKLVQNEGKARATVYKLTDKRSMDQIVKENWEMRNQIRELENESIENAK